MLYINIMKKCGILVNLILLILSPIYLLGIFFWEDKTAYSLIDDYNNKLAKPFKKDN